LFAFSTTLSAQTSSVEGNVTGADRRPLNDAEIRFEQRGRAVSPIVSRADVNGHYNVIDSRTWLLEIALVLVRFDHVGERSTNHPLASRRGISFVGSVAPNSN
jgi:hypothetical protein